MKLLYPSNSTSEYTGGHFAVVRSASWRWQIILVPEPDQHATVAPFMAPRAIRGIIRRRVDAGAQ